MTITLENDGSLKFTPQTQEEANALKILGISITASFKNEVASVRSSVETLKASIDKLVAAQTP